MDNKQLKPYHGKAIYNPSGKAGEYSYWACNFYVGCSNGCQYCYCKKGILAPVMGQDEPQLKKCFRDEEHAFTAFEAELQANIEQLRQHGLFFSFTTDPLLPECSDLTWRSVMLAMENDVPVKILTKMSGPWVDQLIADMHQSWKGFIAIGFTLTGHDELEPFASPNVERIKAMRKLHNAGFKTWASIEPIIDFENSALMIEATQSFCDLYKVGLMSGQKYDEHECRHFVSHFAGASNLVGYKIYFKDSLMKAAKFNRSTFSGNVVGRDYNLFTAK
jgi:DNA repair photolyase